MEVKITGKEILNCATNPKVSLIKLSENDNGMVRVYTQFCFFYQNKDGEPEFMPEARLQSSLKKVLEDFPELVGRMNILPDGSLEVECKNQGVQWLSASTPGSMKDLASENFAQQKLPDKLVPPLTPQDGFLLGVQLTRFQGDDSALLAVSAHHAVADGQGVFHFIKCWSDTCLGKLVDQPLSDRSLYSRNGEEPISDHPELRLQSSLSQEEVKDFQTKIATLVPNLTAHVFSASRTSLDQLKKDVMETQKKLGITCIVSTNDAVSGLLWRSALLPRNIPPDHDVMILMACNGRKRSVPKLPETYIGNSNFFVRVNMTARELMGQDGLGIAAAKIREGVDSITPEWIQSSLNWVAKQKNKSDIVPGFNFVAEEDYSITTWAGFPIYQTDFGWGIPTRFRVAAKGFNNLALIFPPSPGCEGLEITLGLSKNVMQGLLSDQLFKKYFTLVG